MLINKHFRRGSALLLTAAVLISIISLISLPAYAVDPTGVDLEAAQAIYLYNIENDKVLYEKNIYERIQPVSTVKIMAGLIAVEMLGDKLDDVIVVTEAMLTGVEGQHYNIFAGHTLSVRDLLYLAFCGGCHKSINILAHVISGNPANFIAVMNSKAKALGMNDTFYTNVTGMHSDTMYTTVSDIAKLCIAASKNPLLMQITTTDAHTIEKLGSREFTFENRNYLVGTGYTPLYYNPLCHGLSAGSTFESGYCVATVADNGDLSYLCIVMGAGTDNNGRIQSYDIANDIIDWAYTSWGYVEIISAGVTICEMPVTMSMEIDSVLVVPLKSFSAYLPTSTLLGTDITYNYTLNSEKLQAPVSEGAFVGTITAYKDGQEIASVDLVTKTSIAQSEVLYTLAKIKEISQSRVFMASVIFAVCFIFLYVLIKALIRGSASGKRYRYRK